MKTTFLWMMAGLNILLALGLCFKVMSPNVAYGQVARPSDYVTVPSTLPGQPNGIVYVLDTQAGELSAISFDDSNGKTNVMPKIDLKSVFGQTAAHK